MPKKAAKILIIASPSVVAVRAVIILYYVRRGVANANEAKWPVTYSNGKHAFWIVSLEAISISLYDISVFHAMILIASIRMLLWLNWSQCQCHTCQPIVHFSHNKYSETNNLSTDTFDVISWRLIHIITRISITRPGRECSWKKCAKNKCENKV